MGIALAVRMGPGGAESAAHLDKPGQLAPRRQVRRAAAGGAAGRLKVKERGVGCDAFCLKQVSEGVRYRYSFQLLIEIGTMPKVV